MTFRVTIDTRNLKYKQIILRNREHMNLVNMLLEWMAEQGVILFIGVSFYGVIVWLREMSAPSLKSTAILTEHLKYPPISLLDDIINNVNDIMYKCTAAMEKYLLRKGQIEGVDYSEEIRAGIAKLETLLEHTVDKNFDKFELYALRNVLRIPDELIEQNVFLLKHQQGLDMSWLAKQKDADNDVVDDIRQFQMKFVEFENKLLKNQELKKRINKVKTLQGQVKQFRLLVMEAIKTTLEESSQMDENIKNSGIFESLKPIDDALRFLISQLKQLYNESEEFCSTEDIQTLVKRNIEQRDSGTMHVTRTNYIDSRVGVILEDLSISDNSTHRNNVREGEICTIEIKDPDLSLFPEMT